VSTGGSPHLFFALSGVGSALLTISLLPSSSKLSLLLGGVFGVVVSICLVLCGISDRSWRTFLFIAMTIVAYLVGVGIAFTVQLSLPPRLLLISPAELWSLGHGGAVSPVALFFGGTAGALAVLFGAAPLAKRRLANRTVMFRCVGWSLFGGAFAILGWVLRDSLGVILWNVFRYVQPASFQGSPEDELRGLGPVDLVCAVYFMWQLGIAVVLGVMLGAGAEKSRPMEQQAL
jgi:hypothetical protein